MMDFFGDGGEDGEDGLGCFFPEDLPQLPPEWRDSWLPSRRNNSAHEDEDDARQPSPMPASHATSSYAAPPSGAASPLRQLRAAAAGAAPGSASTWPIHHQRGPARKTPPLPQDFASAEVTPGGVTPSSLPPRTTSVAQCGRCWVGCSHGAVRATAMASTSDSDGDSSGAQLPEGLLWVQHCGGVGGSAGRRAFGTAHRPSSAPQDAIRISRFQHPAGFEPEARATPARPLPPQLMLQPQPQPQPQVLRQPVSLQQQPQNQPRWWKSAPAAPPAPPAADLVTDPPWPWSRHHHEQLLQRTAPQPQPSAACWAGTVTNQRQPQRHQQQQQHPQQQQRGNTQPWNRTRILLRALSPPTAAAAMRPAAGLSAPRATSLEAGRVRTVPLQQVQLLQPPRPPPRSPTTPPPPQRPQQHLAPTRFPQRRSYQQYNEEQDLLPVVHVTGETWWVPSYEMVAGTASVAILDEAPAAVEAAAVMKPFTPMPPPAGLHAIGGAAAGSPAGWAPANFQSSAQHALRVPERRPGSHHHQPWFPSVGAGARRLASAPEPELPGLPVVQVVAVPARFDPPMAYLDDPQVGMATPLKREFMSPEDSEQQCPAATTAATAAAAAVAASSAAAHALSMPYESQQYEPYKQPPSAAEDLVNMAEEDDGGGGGDGGSTTIVTSSTDDDDKGVTDSTTAAAVVVSTAAVAAEPEPPRHGGGSGGRRRSGARAVTLEALRSMYDLPIQDVVRELGVSVTELKRRCRALGIQRWPQRKLFSLRRLAESGMVGNSWHGWQLPLR